MSQDLQAYRRSFQARLERKRKEQESRRWKALRAARQKAPMVLAAWPSVRRAYLFGSVTRPGAFHKGSDIDIAIAGSATAQEYFAIWRAIEQVLPDWTIDLRTIDSASTFADLVRKTGILIYEREDTSPASGDTGRSPGD